MVKYKVEYDANTCIGSLQCIWEAKEILKEDENGFTELVGGKLNEATGKYELIIDEKLYEKAKAAESSCPVEAIKVTEL